MANKYDLARTTILPFGKYKGSSTEEAVRADSSYFVWVAENTAWNVMDFEALTGLTKPTKEPKSALQYKGGEDGGLDGAPKQAWTPQGSTAQGAAQAPRREYPAGIPTPKKEKVSDELKFLTPEDFFGMTRLEFIYTLHNLTKAYHTTHNRTLLNDAMNIQLVDETGVKEMAKVTSGDGELDEDKSEELPF